MECRISKLKTLGLFGMAGVLVGLCYYGTTMPVPKAHIVGWIGVAFFGLMLVLLPFQFFRDAPQVVIDDDGIDDRRTRLGRIRWADIRAIKVGRIKSTGFLCLELVEPKTYLSRLSPWQRRFASASKAQGLSDVSMSFTGLSPGINEVWAHLQTIPTANARMVAST